MAITHQISGIDFTNIKTSTSGKLPAFAGSEIYRYTTEELNEDFGVGGDLPTIINAVEIDWNGAEIGGQIINSTGDLIKVIQG